jgi:hypothetical protein
VNDRELEKLLRVAIELEELERGASSPQRERDEVHAEPLTAWTRGVPILWRIAVPAAAAAALALAFFPTPASRETVASVPSVAIEYWPGEHGDDGVRVDCFESTSTERCSVMAIFHSWRHECQCVEWQLYEWEDGRPLAELSPDEVRGIALDVTNAPPVEQLLVVAIAKDPTDLPEDEAAAIGLIACLDEVAPASAEDDRANEYAAAVRTCLPKSVRVVHQPFYVK